MLRRLATRMCLWGTIALSLEAQAEPTKSMGWDHLDGAFIFINDSHPTPNIVSDWRSEGSSVVLQVRNGIPARDVESLIRETFESQNVERVADEVWIHQADLGSVLQVLSTLFLPSAPFRVADGRFIGCVILPKAVSEPSQFTPSRKPPWMIKSNGVGDVNIGQRLTDAVVAREGVTRNKLYQSGRFNPDGFVVLRLQHMKIQVTLLADERVMSIRPSSNIKTDGDIGIGSNLRDLNSAHRGVTLEKISKPYACAASSRDLPGVRFVFLDCRKACLGDSKVREVIWNVPSTETI
jgi:hypothetical protein